MIHVYLLTIVWCFLWFGDSSGYMVPLFSGLSIAVFIYEKFTSEQEPVNFYDSYFWIKNTVIPVNGIVFSCYSLALIP